MIPRGKCFGRLRTDGWSNGCCRKWVWEHSNGDPAYPWVEPPSNQLCQQSNFTILDSTLQNPNPLTQTLIPLSSSLNWTSKPLSSHSTYTLQITLTQLRTSTIHLYKSFLHSAIQNLYNLDYTTTCFQSSYSWLLHYKFLSFLILSAQQRPTLVQEHTTSHSEPYLIFVTGTTGGACVKIFCRV